MTTPLSLTSYWTLWCGQMAAAFRAPTPVPLVLSIQLTMLTTAVDLQQMGLYQRSQS